MNKFAIGGMLMITTLFSSMSVFANRDRVSEIRYEAIVVGTLPFNLSICGVCGNPNSCIKSQNIMLDLDLSGVQALIQPGSVGSVTTVNNSLLVSYTQSRDSNNAPSPTLQTTVNVHVPTSIILAGIIAQLDNMVTSGILTTREKQLILDQVTTQWSATNTTLISYTINVTMGLITRAGWGSEATPTITLGRTQPEPIYQEFETSYRDPEINDYVYQTVTEAVNFINITIITPKIVNINYSTCDCSDPIFSKDNPLICCEENKKIDSNSDRILDTCCLNGTTPQDRNNDGIPEVCLECSDNNVCNLQCPTGKDPDCSKISCKDNKCVLDPNGVLTLNSCSLTCCEESRKIDSNKDKVVDLCCEEVKQPIDSDGNSVPDLCEDCDSDKVCNPKCPLGKDPDCVRVSCVNNACIPSALGNMNQGTCSMSCCTEGDKIDSNKDKILDLCCEVGKQPIDSDGNAISDMCEDCDVDAMCNPKCPVGKDPDCNKVLCKNNVCSYDPAGTGTLATCSVSCCLESKKIDSNKDKVLDLCCEESKQPIDSDGNAIPDLCEDCDADKVCNPKCPVGKDPDCGGGSSGGGSSGGGSSGGGSSGGGNCGNGVIDRGEQCDEGSQNNGVKSICTKSCTLKGLRPTPDALCSFVDPPSIQFGEILPFWWGLDEHDPQIDKSGSCTVDKEGNVSLGSLMCNFSIQPPNTKGSVQYFTIPCATRDLQDANWYRDLQDDLSVVLQPERGQSYLETKDWGKGVYGEYAIRLDSIQYALCSKKEIAQGTGVIRDYFWEEKVYSKRVCQYNFAVTAPYMMQNGSSLSSFQDDQKVLESFHLLDGRKILNTTEVKNINFITTTSTTNDFSALQKQAYDELIKIMNPVERTHLLAPLANEVKKAVNQELYLIESNATINTNTQLNHGKPTTIVVKGPYTLTIQGSLSANVMILVPEGEVVFENRDCDNADIVNGIIIAKKMSTRNSGDSLLNNSIHNKERCQGGQLIIKGVLVTSESSSLGQIRNERRATLNDWFTLQGQEKENAIYAGASLRIDVNSKSWSNLPPLAKISSLVFKLQSKESMLAMPIILDSDFLPFYLRIMLSAKLVDEVE